MFNPGDLLEIPLGDNKFGYCVVVFNYDAPPKFGKLIKVICAAFDCQQKPETVTKIFGSVNTFYSFIVINKNDVSSCGINIISKLDAEIITDNELPKMWTVRPGIKDDDLGLDIPKHIIVTAPGSGKEDKYLRKEDVPQHLSSFSVITLDSLKSKISNNYKPEKELNIIWENN